MRVPLQIDNHLGIERRHDTLLGGVPLEKGSLARGGWFELIDANQQRSPVYGQPAAFWPDGSVKWLHLCGPINLAAGCQRFDLHLQEQTPPTGSTITVRQTDDAIELASSHLTVQVGPNVDGWVRACHADAAAVSGLVPVLELVGADDDAPLLRRCEFSIDSDLELAVHTPNRVVVRTTGRFTDEGREVAQLRLFIELMAHSAELRLEPVFIYLGDPDRDLIRRHELQVRTSLGQHLPSIQELLEHVKAPITPAETPSDQWVGAQPIDGSTYGFGQAQGPGYWDKVRPYVSLARFPIARQVQLGSSFHRIEKRVDRACSWVKMGEGQQAQGWCHLNNNSAGITAAIRYFWQEYPAALEVDAAAGTLTFGLWPASAAPLDLRRYSPIRYGHNAYEVGNGPFPAQTHGATGIAKARELVLQFHAHAAATPEQQRAVAAAALSFLHPLRPMATGNHMARSRVVGQLAAACEQSHPAAEQRVAQIIDFLASERDRNGWYGLMDFGDLVLAYYSDLQRWASDDGGYGWINTEHLPDYGLWINALRHARADWLNFAIEMSRHNRDVDTYHHGNFIGSGSRHNVNHWGCSDKEWRVSMPLARRLHYYTTADPWTAEVIRACIKTYQSYERTSKAAPSMSSALIGVMTRWEMTGDPAVGQAVRNMADAYARAFRPDGSQWSQMHVNIATGVGHPIEKIAGTEADVDREFFFMDGFGGQHALCELADLLEHQDLASALVRYAHYRLDQLAKDQARSNILYMRHGPLVTLSHAFRCSGDTRFLDAIHAAVSEIRSDLVPVGGPGLLESPPRLAPQEVTRRNKYTCWLASYLHTLPYALHALQPAAAEPQVQR